MRAVVVTEFGAEPVVADVPEPDCPPDGAVIEVRATGLCRSDWHAWRGHDTDIRLPFVPGHEFAGVVAAAGDRVVTWHVGDRVTSPFVCACGDCEQCHDGAGQVCPNQEQPGFTYDGSFAERVVVPRADVNLVALPASMSYAAAASLGCRFATAYRAVVLQGRVSRGEWVAVHGCGGVGLSAVMVARAAGARVVGVDVSSGARTAAAALGAEVVEGGEGAAMRVREVTGGGAHLSLDAFGSRATAAASVLSLRRRGRHVQVGLLFGADASPPMPMGPVIAHELEILGSHGLAAGDYPAMFDLVRDGGIELAGLVAQLIGLDDIPATLTGLDRPGAGGVTVAVLGR